MVCVAQTIVLLRPSLTTWFLSIGYRGFGEIGWTLAWSLSFTQTLSAFAHMQSALEGAGGPQGPHRGLEGHVSSAPGGLSTPLGDLRGLLCLEMFGPFVAGRPGQADVQLEASVLKAF